MSQEANSPSNPFVPWFPNGRVSTASERSADESTPLGDGSGDRGTGSGLPMGWLAFGALLVGQILLWVVV